MKTSTEDHAVFMKLQIERLKEHGTLELSAKGEWFEGFWKDIKMACPEAEYVSGIGRFAIEKVIYIPSAKDDLIRRLRRDLAEFSKAAQGTSDALQKLTTT